MSGQSWGARRFMMTAAITVILAGLAVSGRAEQPAVAPDQTREEQDRACRSDALRLCAFDIPFESKITACMERKLDRLSPACRAMFK